MSESNPSSISSLGVDRSKEGFDDAKAHRNHQHRETHGRRDDIDQETSITDVKAPNVFERAKEEIEAIVEAIHPRKEADVKNHGLVSDDPTRVSDKVEETKQQCSDPPPPEKSSKSLGIFEKAKQDIEAKLHKKDKSPHHHKETHGRSDDIDENTPIVEVKGPGVFERAKEEFEAAFEALHPKKDSVKAKTSPKNEGGLRVSIGKRLEKICSPGTQND